MIKNEPVIKPRFRDDLFAHGPGTGQHLKVTPVTLQDLEGVSRPMFGSRDRSSTESLFIGTPTVGPLETHWTSHAGNGVDDQPEALHDFCTIPYFFGSK